MRPEDQPARRMPVWWAGILLVLSVLLPNANSLGAFFVGDDFDFLARMQALGGARDAWGMTFWGEWNPLWYLGFYRDWTWWGLDPVGYHAASLFWNALGVVALFWLVRELWPEASLAPWAAALLFATHPLHDEAVTYLAARGHPMATALALLGLGAYARMRRSTEPRGRGWIGWWLAALTAAWLAALAKETAVVMPLWIAALEWSVLGGLRRELGRVGAALRAGAFFLAPVALYLILRHAVVGMGSRKLVGGFENPGKLLESCLGSLPEYALVGGLPFPFAFLEGGFASAWRWLGWAVVGVVVLPAVVAVVRAWCRRGAVSRPVGIYVFGLVVASSSLLPLFWADLGLRRRYFYAASAGAALALAVALEWLAARRRRTAWACVALLTLGGALGLVHRNDLYRQAGRISRNLLETARGAPLGQPSTRRPGETRRVALVTLPRFVGGDGFSGAYLLHRTDVLSVLRLAGVALDGFAAGHKCDYAEDFAARVVFESDAVFDLVVSFRTRRAYEAARRRSPREDRTGDGLAVVLASADDASQVIAYKVVLDAGFFRDGSAELLLFSDGRFLPLRGSWE